MSNSFRMDLSFKPLLIQSKRMQRFKFSVNMWEINQYFDPIS